ncbi:uncharacterized protein LOC114759619 [Neltuma alba]|uniref:uncharacterized protein LOC114759619 n=1 Tax=Neltuma alba TaxID=207710 RepID=UPI0010A4DCB7|nr:uncharacterized protein LOC114759619 [Prosopis alba]
MTWNTRGAGDASFRRLLSDLMVRNNVNIFALLEPRQDGEKAGLIARRLGWPNKFLVEARGFSGGIWLFWDMNTDFVVLSSSDQFVHGKVRNGNGDEWLLTFVYGHPNTILRRQLWQSLHNIYNASNMKWAVAGDFNVVAHSEDRWGRGRQGNSRIDRLFRAWITNCGLIDIGFSGPRFTWGYERSQSRIDRVFVNDLWHIAFPNAAVVHLSKYKSDHCPVLLKTDNFSTDCPNNRPFRFFAPWVLHDEFHNFVKENWLPQHDWGASVFEFTKKLLTWNKEVFGNIT